MAVIATAVILAVCAIISVAPARVPPLAQPIDVRFQLADGVRVAGQMTACDDDGFDGSFGRREWIELQFDDAWKLHQRIMNAESAGDWVNLGRIMLLLSDKQPLAGTRAETALRRALQIDAALEDEVERVKEEVAAAGKAARDAARAAESQRLTTLSPESGPTMRPGGAPWSATLWPAQTDEERGNAILTVRADAEQVLKQAGVTIAPAETEHFLVYSELDRPQTADWALRLERVHKALEFVLNPGLDPSAKDKPIRIQPWGKVVVFIWKEQDRFKMVEAETFRHLVPNASLAVCHFSGPRAFINCWRELDEEAFEWALYTEAVHALMHRCISPRRLPAWANDGLAEIIASRANKYSLLGKERRKQALDFIRASGDLNTLLDLRYEDATFPGRDGVGAPVGGLILELMMNEKPTRLVRWIVAVKSGLDWSKALRDEYATTRGEIVGIATQYYKVND